jgi:hypothetical protein
LPSTSLDVLTLYSPFGKVMHMHQAVCAMTFAAECTLGLLHVHIIGQLRQTLAFLSNIEFSQLPLGFPLHVHFTAISCADFRVQHTDCPVCGQLDLQTHSSRML